MSDGARLGHLPRWLLVSPLLPLYLTALIASLGLPSLGLGFIGDDYFQRVWILGSARFPGLDPALLHSRLLDMHVMVGRDRSAMARQIDVGMLPWWTAPDLRISGFRPMAALTHGIDYRLWPDSPPLMHAHSLLWAALCVVAATLLYRRLLGPSSPAVAGLAACLFAVDSAHALPSYWVYNRNALVALFFGILAVLAHVRHREEGWRPGVLVAPVLLAAALLSTEAGVCTMAYLVAHAVFLDRGTFRERTRALLPYLPVLLVWQLLYAGMGYGLRGSSLYMDPLAEPLRFLGALAQRGPFLLLGHWIDLDLMMLLLRAGRRLWVIGLVSSVAVGAALLPLLRREGTARFWALGMLLSVVPTCMAPPSARRLLFPGLGAAALLAQFLATAVRLPGTTPRWRRVLTVLVCVFLVLGRGVLGPTLLFAKALPFEGMARFVDVGRDQDVARQTLVVLNPPAVITLMLLPFVRAVEGRAVPFRIRGLAASGASGWATRTDDRTLSVRVKGGYLTDLQDTAFRDGRPMRPGQRIELEGLAVEVVSIKEDGRPWEVRFRFDVPLEHSSLRWLQWRSSAYAPFRPPAPGEAVEFTAAGAEPARQGT